MVRKNFNGGDFDKNHRTGFSQSNRKPVEKYDNKFNPKNVPKKQSEENFQTFDQFIMNMNGNKACDSNNSNSKNGFSQSKKSPVGKYDDKFNSKNDPEKQSMIPSYQMEESKDQNPPQNHPIIGQKGIQNQAGNYTYHPRGNLGSLAENKGCDSNRNPKNGVWQSKRKPVDKYGNKFNSKNGPKMPTYQMEESNELPISDTLDQESDFAGSALAQTLRNFRRKTHGNPCLSKDQSPPEKQTVSSKDHFMQKICKTEKKPWEDGTGLHFFFKKQDAFLFLEEAVKEESEALMEASENSDDHEEYLAYIHERIPEVSKRLNDLNNFIKRYWTDKSMPQECVPFIFCKDFQTVKFVSSTDPKRVLVVFI